MITRRNLELAHIALEYAISDAVEELTQNKSTLTFHGRVLLNSIDTAKNVIKSTFDVLGNLESAPDVGRPS